MWVENLFVMVCRVCDDPENVLRMPYWGRFLLTMKNVFLRFTFSDLTSKPVSTLPYN